MRNHLPEKYTCPKCNRTSNSKGYYCSFCGNKKEKPNSQFIEYDFDLFPQPLINAGSFQPRQQKKYIRKVIISFALILFMGLGFYLPYTITKNLTKHEKLEIFEINVSPENRFQTQIIKNKLDLKSTNLNTTKNAEFIENNFDIYYESKELYNINSYFKDKTPGLTDLATKLTVDTIISQTEGNISVAINDDEYIIVLKFTNREFAYSIEKILSETDYKSKVIDDYLLVSNSQNYLDRNIESYKGDTKNLSKSGYFIDTLSVLPETGQVFIFIKNKKGQEYFEKTTGITAPSIRYPIGIIIDDDKLYYKDFTF